MGLSLGAADMSCFARKDCAPAPADCLYALHDEQGDEDECCNIIANTCWARHDIWQTAEAQGTPDIAGGAPGCGEAKRAKVCDSSTRTGVGSRSIDEELILSRPWSG